MNWTWQCMNLTHARLPTHCWVRQMSSNDLSIHAWIGRWLLVGRFICWTKRRYYHKPSPSFRKCCYMTMSDLCTAVEIWYVNPLEFGIDYIGHDHVYRICLVLGMLLNHKELWFAFTSSICRRIELRMFNLVQWIIMVNHLQAKILLS